MNSWQERAQQVLAPFLAFHSLTPRALGGWALELRATAITAALAHLGLTRHVPLNAFWACWGGQPCRMQ